MILYNLETAPASYPVTLPQAKDATDVTDHDDDDKLDLLIAAATEAVEVMTGKQIVTQTWSRTSPCAVDRIEIERAPLIAVTALDYFDRDNAAQTLTLTDFFTYKDADRSFFEPKPNTQWPDFYDRQDALKITFTVGFSTVPPALKNAILMLVAHWFDAPRAASEKPMREIPLGVSEMVQLHRIGWAA